MKRATWRRVVVLLVGTIVLWVVSGVAGSLGTWLWWIVAAAPMAGMIGAPFLLYRISGGRTWPTWLAFVPAMVLLGTSLAVPGDWYMRNHGTPAVATVGEATCSDNGEGRCLYNYTLYDQAGEQLPGEFRDTVEYAPGETIDVVTDPRGLFGPRLAIDVRDRIFELITLIAFVVYVLVALVAGLIGDRWPLPGTRQHDRRPPPGSRQHGRRSRPVAPDDRRHRGSKPTKR